MLPSPPEAIHVLSIGLGCVRLKIIVQIQLTWSCGQGAVPLKLLGVATITALVSNCGNPNTCEDICAVVVGTLIVRLSEEGKSTLDNKSRFRGNIMISFLNIYPLV